MGDESLDYEYRESEVFHSYVNFKENIDTFNYELAQTTRGSQSRYIPWSSVDSYPMGIQWYDIAPRTRSPFPLYDKRTSSWVVEAYISFADDDMYSFSTRVLYLADDPVAPLIPNGPVDKLESIALKSILIGNRMEVKLYANGNILSNHSNCTTLLKASSRSCIGDCVQCRRDKGAH